jgi:glycosyltransferase involved in cell wall biosynthesis
MSTSSELTIVIPAKNEAKLIPRLLSSLVMQDYGAMSSTPVLVADAGSTDGTAEIVLRYADRLAVRVIAGGLPSVGRNAGARLAASPYVLFIDADMELRDATLVRHALELMRQKQLHCVTTNIAASDGSLSDRLLYAANNLVQRLSPWFFLPFSTGMFMLFDRKVFEQLGGFHEQVAFAEDYLLSKKVSPHKFAVVGGRVHTTSRRFRKMGRWNMVRLFLKTALNSWNERYFLQDHKYWQT